MDANEIKNQVSEPPPPFAPPPIRVCYFGTYRTEYSRNQIMIAGLRAASVEVSECHEVLWRGIEDRVQAVSGGWARFSFILRVVQVYLRLAWRGLRLPEYDILICGYPGHFDVFLARLLSKLRRRPLVWDVFMSIYLITLERGLDQKSRFTVTLLRKIEGLALHLPERLIQDTAEYVTWLNQTHGVPQERFRLVPTGADDRTFQRLPGVTQSNPDSFRVLYYGTFIPNHGVPYIIEAARLLKDEPGLYFELVGEGPELEHCQELVRNYGLTRVNFSPWTPQSELVQKMAQSDLCLGAFGQTPQSLMTVQNKIYEGLAMARPVVTGDSPTVRSGLQHGNQIWLCDRTRPESLADAIRTLRANPELRRQIAENGYALFCKNYSVAKLGERFRTHLEEVIKS